MKAQVWTSILGLALLAATCVGGATILTSSTDAKAAKADRKIEGTWLVQVTLHNCQTGDNLRTFPALLTFAKGGTLTETTAGFPPAARTPGHGFWKTNGGSYTAVSVAFLFGPDGTLTGKQTITQTIEFGADPDAFNSTASTTIADPNGNTIMTGCATAVAHRME